MVLSQVKVTISCTGQEVVTRAVDTEKENWKTELDDARTWLNTIVTSYIESRPEQVGDDGHHGEDIELDSEEDNEESDSQSKKPKNK